jgi:hypothetical protein
LVLDAVTRDHRTLNNHVPVLDGSYEPPNGQRALPFEVVEIPKETGRDDSHLTFGLRMNVIVGCPKRTPKPVDRFGHNG